MRWSCDQRASAQHTELRGIHSVLLRSLKPAQARDMVKRHIVQLCDAPQERSGRPSKSPLHAYIVLSLLVGARTEEMCASVAPLDLIGRPDADPPVPLTIEIWRSVRATGGTKKPKSRRTLTRPTRAVRAVAARGESQNKMRAQLSLICQKSSRRASGRVPRHPGQAAPRHRRRRHCPGRGPQWLTAD